MSHSPKMDVDQSLMAKIKDQNENGMHRKISTTVPNCPKSQIKDAVRNMESFLLLAFDSFTQLLLLVYIVGRHKPIL
jgi:hypothetical protein